MYYILVHIFLQVICIFSETKKLISFLRFYVKSTRQEFHYLFHSIYTFEKVSNNNFHWLWQIIYYWKSHVRASSFAPVAHSITTISSSIYLCKICDVPFWNNLLILRIFKIHQKMFKNLEKKPNFLDV